jgi:hypothetical protein
MKKFFILFLFFLLSACTTKVDGTYTSINTSSNKSSYTFSKNGKVSSIIFGVKKETSYQIDGNEIKFRFDGGLPRLFILEKDGTIDAGTYGKYIKDAAK